jgi:hypothetical protein
MRKPSRPEPDNRAQMGSESYRLAALDPTDRGYEFLPLKGGGRSVLSIAKDTPGGGHFLRCK